MDSKKLQKDYRVFLGYSQETNLDAASDAELAAARGRLSMLSGRELLEVCLFHQRSCLTVDKPSRKQAAGQ